MVGSLASFDVALLQPGHQAAKTSADLLNRMLLTGLAEDIEVFATTLGFGDPAFGELAALDVLERFFHALLDRGIDDGRAGRDVAVLGGLGDRETHPGDAGLVDQIDGELEFVEALEVGHLGLVAGLDKDFVGGGDQLADTTAKDGLLAEKIGFSLFFEIGLEDSGPGAADAFGPRAGRYRCCKSRRSWCRESR